ncbi:E3 ubiquitin-protein ligase TRAIP-like [Patiria miniata]|uniref:RING-type domain-containing protein n=1 Tax=Patiria miniata TaxID=46514 RepID=A0A914BLN4_PATMI|nr:E3 ubiquitin-protein ligase TRAIP-like [Patiria miniata]
MINACCTICHDHFEGDVVVSACPCGHTFHEDCLLKWLSTSLTCPQCRQRATGRTVIKLFFEAGSDTSEDDPSKLKNELSALQAELKKRDSTKKNLAQENERHSNTIRGLNKKVKDLLHNLQAEQTTSDALKKQLSLLSYQIDEAKQAKKETKRLREKLQFLERLQRVLTDNAEATESLLSEYGDGPRAAKELATYCVTLKREFENNKLRRSQLKNELDEARRKLSTSTKNLMKTSQELERAHNQLRGAEEDLQCALKEKQTLKDRLASLQTTMESPSGASKSALTRLIMESPAPCQFKTPKLSTPDNGTDISLDDGIPSNPGNPSTPSLFDEPSPSVLAKKECREFGLPFVKTTSLAHKNKKFKSQSSEESDAMVMSAIANSGLFGNRRPLQDSGSNFRKGYDGLGGHGSFIKPSGISVRGIKRRTHSSTRRPSVNKTLPKLPTLDKFL